MKQLFVVNVVRWWTEVTYGVTRELRRREGVMAERREGERGVINRRNNPQDALRERGQLINCQLQPVVTGLLDVLAERTLGVVFAISRATVLSLNPVCD